MIKIIEREYWQINDYIDVNLVIYLILIYFLIYGLMHYAFID